MQTENVIFPGALGHDLSGKIDYPDDGVSASWVVFAHGFSVGKDLKPIRTISKSLVDEGYGMLRFDFTGLGQSDGNFADTNFSTNVKEILNAATYLRENFEAPRTLIGHSFGGTAMLKAAEDIPESRAVATIGSPCSTSHIVHHFADKLDEIEAEGQAEVLLAGRPFTIKDQFVKDAQSHDVAADLDKLDRALLVFHSPQDETVSIDNAGHIFKLARHPKSFVTLDGADHLLLKNHEDADYVGRVLAAWAKRYVCSPSEA